MLLAFGLSQSVRQHGGTGHGPAVAGHGGGTVVGSRGGARGSSRLSGRRVAGGSLGRLAACGGLGGHQRGGLGDGGLLGARHRGRGRLGSRGGANRVRGRGGGPGRRGSGSAGGAAGDGHGHPVDLGLGQSVLDGLGPVRGRARGVGGAGDVAGHGGSAAKARKYHWTCASQTRIWGSTYLPFLSTSTTWAEVGAAVAVRPFLPLMLQLPAVAWGQDTR